MEKTFILIKPDAMKRNLAEVILNIFKSESLIIQRSKTVKVSEERIIAHYQEVIDRLNLPYFEQAILNFFKDQEVLIAEVVSESNTIVRVRELIGATDPAKADSHSIRGMFGIDSFEKASKESRMIENLIHASDSKESAEFELALWFEGV
ncbi:MAG: nucleoside-diphosphate kinase [Acholeplasmataceae bacterium]